MEITYSKIPYKVIRFDINRSIISPINNCDFINELFYQQGLDDGNLWIGLRITTHIIDKNLNKEIVGYIFDFRALAKIKNIDNDLNDIKKFIGNALLNHQLYFQQNAPKEISLNQLILKPNKNEYAENLLNLLIESDYYE